jgi:poly-beta-1,6-N-acetyl-D-glucosamine synthase
MHKKVSVAVCIPAYNEEKNIRHILDALLAQQTEKIVINKIVVVSSGSTDQTDTIVHSYARKHTSIQLLKQPERNGKAAAINAFLQITNEEIIVIESADTIPMRHTIETLCLPFLADERIGLTGGAPYPINDPTTFLGYIIHAWWWFHRNIPRYGELIAFRNVLPQISETTAVDEAYIQAKLLKAGYTLLHVDDAIVTNKGPETISDLIKQRRRIFNGHARLHKEENIRISNMTTASLRLLLFSYQIESLKHLVWILSGIQLEILSRLLGIHDMLIKKRNPYIWHIASTTKDLKNRTFGIQAVAKSLERA